MIESGLVLLKQRIVLILTMLETTLFSFANVLIVYDGTNVIRYRFKFTSVVIFLLIVM